MWASDGFCFGFGCWWIIPLAMIVMMVLCFFMMRRGMARMMCVPSSHARGPFWRHESESAREILDKRYARGEIGKEEYEQKKADLERTSG